MRPSRLVDGNGVLRLPRLWVTESRWELTRGLLARPRPDDDEGLWLTGCGAIHTAFMRYAIDALFLGADGRVLRVAAGLRPWRMARAPGAVAVLEMADGGARRHNLAPGQILRPESTGE